MDPHERVTVDKKRSIKDVLTDSPLYGLGAVVGVLMVPAVLYMGYDLASSELNPCESIYQQSSVGLTTKIKFLESEGELQIGRQKLQDLDDRAQRVALNLKACCTVLDAGKLDPEQFLQCKAKGRDYDARIDQLVALVKQAVAAPGKPQPATVATAEADGVVTGSVKPAPTKAAIRGEIQKTVEKAQAVSKDFNMQLVQVQDAQAVKQLKAVVPKNIKVDAQEREPNNTILATNEIELGSWVKGAIAAKGDWDYYRITTPSTHRDWLSVEVENRSTSLRPRVVIFNSEKAEIGSKVNGTSGGDVKHSYVVGPDETYYVAVGDRYSELTGAYLFKAIATKSYDAHEPNQNVLQAKKMVLGSEIEGSVMDGRDWDFYVFKTDGAGGKAVATLENRSLTLKPKVLLYNASKTYVGEKINGTQGGDAAYKFDIPAGKKFFVAVTSRYGDTAGDYTLTVEKE